MASHPVNMMHGGPGGPGATDFDRAPFLLIWEVTQACGLACRHCRAEAVDTRHPLELTTDEGRKLIDDTVEMGTRIIVFSGGDPFQRADLEDLIRHAKSRKMRTGTIPAATERVTPERILSMKGAGLDQFALSLDGHTAQQHDTFRGIQGAFDATLAAAKRVRDAGMALQINTVFGTWNYESFDELCALVEGLGIAFWEVFFLVPTGRGTDLECLKPEKYELLFAKIYALQKRAPFIVKITEAPHYRMFVAEAEKKNRAAEAGPVGQRVKHLLARETGPGGSMGQAPKGVNSGKGFVFVSHVGEIFPSGFLPIRAGNVRTDALADIYRNSEVFRALRDPRRLKGRCGRCNYNDLCGGSRSRAYALTGDYLAEDEACSYVPPDRPGVRAS